LEKNCAKIVLKANAKQMYELSQHDSARSINDNGLTQVPENSLTAVAFFPGSLAKDDVKDYKLL
jgi:peptidyl-tRNA hydrolase